MEAGRPVGHFLTAILENDLYMAVGRADEENQEALADYVKWLYHYAPMTCWGSRENVKNWYDKKLTERQARIHKLEDLERQDNG